MTPTTPSGAGGLAEKIARYHYISLSGEASHHPLTDAERELILAALRAPSAPDLAAVLEDCRQYIVDDCERMDLMPDDTAELLLRIAAASPAKQPKVE